MKLPLGQADNLCPAPVTYNEAVGDCRGKRRGAGRVVSPQFERATSKGANRPLGEDLPRHPRSPVAENSKPSINRPPIMKTKTKAGRYARLKNRSVRDNGQFAPGELDEALDPAAGGFAQTVDRHGPNAFGMFSCSKTTNEMNFIAQKFARVVIGSNNIDSCNRT